MGQVSVTVRDRETRAPIPGAFISLKTPQDPHFSGSTDQDGKFVFVATRTEPYSITVSKEGYLIFSQIFTFPFEDSSYIVDLEQFPDEPEPPRIPSPEEIERIGTSCSITKIHLPGRSPQFNLVHDKKGTLFRSDQYDKAQDAARKTPECFEDVPPTPQGYFEQLSSMLNTLGEQFIGMVDNVRADLASLDDRVSGLWDKLETWLIEKIIVIILKALDREVEQDGRIQNTELDH